jgi:hypothetical protein
VLNMRAAKALGVRVPDALLNRANDFHRVSRPGKPGCQSQPT